MSDDLEAITQRMMGKMRIAEPRPGAAEAAARERREKAEAVMEEIGIPRRLFGATFDAALPLPAITRMREFLDVDAAVGRCLVLSGPPGVGKTWAAVAALNAVAPGTPRRFYYWGDVCTHLLDGVRDRRETLDILKRVRFLVLDDFGVEYAKPGGLLEAFVDALFYHREAACLPTVITTNLLPEDLRTRLSKRVLDRLRGEWGEIFTVPGESMRGRRPE